MFIAVLVSHFMVRKVQMKIDLIKRSLVKYRLVAEVRVAAEDVGVVQLSHPWVGVVCYTTVIEYLPTAHGHILVAAPAHILGLAPDLGHGPDLPLGEGGVPQGQDRGHQNATIVEGQEKLGRLSSYLGFFDNGNNF